MYDAIRQLIRENRLRKAIHDMGDLKLSREHSSRLVTLDRRLQIIENKKIGNLTEDRLIIIEENGLVEDMLIFLDQVEFPQRDAQEHHVDNQGAAAGARQGSKQSSVKWLGLAAAIIALLTIGFLLWPDAPKASPVREASVVVPTEQSSDRLTDEAKEKEAQRLEQERKARVREEEIRRRSASARSTPIEERAAIAAAKARLKAKQEQEVAVNTDFVTPGEQVDIAVAVYSGPASTTKPDGYLTKNLDGFLRRVLKGKSIDSGALTKNFHYSKERELLVFGRSSGDKRLSSRRARYVVLADVRNVDKEGKGDLRMCLYDAATGKSLIRKESVSVGTAPQMLDRNILYAVKAFVEEKLKL